MLLHNGQRRIALQHVHQAACCPHRFIFRCVPLPAAKNSLRRIVPGVHMAHSTKSVGKNATRNLEAVAAPGGCETV